MGEFLVYGANGYTGELIVRESLRRGLRPIIAGRRREPIVELAQATGLEHRLAAVAVPAELDRLVQGVSVVLNCAGPFADTSHPMASACLRGGCHYVDITGEMWVFESLAALDREARQAGVMLLPGGGFDVAPTDCLAAHLHRRLPTATRLTLAISALGAVSRGTATTVLRNLPHGGWIRRGGVLVPASPAEKSRRIDFGFGPVPVIPIPWGDLITAFHSTGIPDIEVWMAAPWTTRLGATVMRSLGGLLRRESVQKFLAARIRAGAPGPTAAQRAQGACHVWGEACDADGRRVVSRLDGPEAYTLTVLSALAIVERASGGGATPGFQTPATAFGPDFVLSLGVTRTDVADAT